jgi:hypothetical protein
MRGTPAISEIMPMPLARLAEVRRPASAKMQGITHAVPKPTSAKAATLVTKFPERLMAANPAVETASEPRASGVQIESVGFPEKR